MTFSHFHFSACRLSDVLLRATSRGIKMETDEAKVIAEKEVMNTYIDELKVNLHREMEQACDDLEMKLKTEFTEEEDRIEKEKIASARMVLVCSVRRWLAKKELRQRCLKTFEKLFDERYKAYYYRNVKTVSNITFDKHCLVSTALNFFTLAYSM